MEAIARELNLQGTVKFAGEVPHGAPIRELLNEADLFVLPSRTEGLPRALLEAMARALPCVATNVGGVPELLAAGFLVPVDRADLLSNLISTVLASPCLLTEMSARNLLVARQFHWNKMAPRRRSFLDRLREATQTWLLRTSPTESARA